MLLQHSASTLPTKSINIWKFYADDGDDEALINQQMMAKKSYFGDYMAYGHQHSLHTPCYYLFHFEISVILCIVLT